MYCHYRQLLDGPRRAMYDWLYPGLMAGLPLLDTGGWPAEELHRVIRALLLDRPELCHFEGAWELRGGLMPHYTLPAALACQLPEAARPFAGASPRQIYDRLLGSVSYDPAGPHSQSAWGALADKRAVCKGIAKGFQLLLHRSGIPCVLVEGSLDGLHRHVWNLVWLEGAWRHVDVTVGYPPFRHFVGGSDGGCGFDFDPASASHRIFESHLLPKEEPR